MKKKEVLKKLRNGWGSLRNAVITGAIVGTLLAMLPNVGWTIDKDLTAEWDPYTDVTATALKLFQNTAPNLNQAITVEFSIPPDSTRWRFIAQVEPGDTLWFAMQALNRDLPLGDPNRESALTAWVPWIYFDAPRPPVPPQGLRITTEFELINP